MRISEAVTEVVESLNAVGIDTTAETSTLVMPGALVIPRGIEYSQLGANPDMEFEVWLVSPKHRLQAQIFDELEDLLTKFRSVYPIKTVTPAALPHTQGTLVPAFLITFTATLKD